MRKQLLPEIKKIKHEAYLFHFFEDIVLHSWWVIVIFLILLMTQSYFYQIQEKKSSALQSQIFHLEKKIQFSRKKWHYLNLEIQSQNDFLWQEQTLKKVLGKVSKGEKKVYFK